MKRIIIIAPIMAVALISIGLNIGTTEAQQAPTPIAFAGCPADCQNMTIYTPVGIYRPNRCPLNEQVFAFFVSRGYARAQCQIVHLPAIADSIDMQRLNAEAPGIYLPGFVEVSDRTHRYRFDECGFNSSRKTADGGFDLVVLCSEAPTECKLKEMGCEPVFGVRLGNKQ